jgi:hypothetical protein
VTSSCCPLSPLWLSCWSWLSSDVIGAGVRGVMRSSLTGLDVDVGCGLGLCWVERGGLRC